MLTYGVVVGVSNEYCKLGELTTNGGIEEILQSSQGTCGTQTWRTLTSNYREQL
jgi:hypothetical protein